MMFKSLITTAALCLIIISTANAQDSRNKKQKDEQKQEKRFQQQSNAYRYVPEEEAKYEKSSKREQRKNKKSFAKAYKKHLDDLVEEFYDRMEANAKRDRKLKRKMDHPKYSDFSYFGHKRKPKIRPVGKRKFCKECGIVH